MTWSFFMYLAAVVWTSAAPCTWGDAQFTLTRQRSHSSLAYLLFGKRASKVAPVVKNLPASAGDINEACLIPGSGRSPEETDNPLQYSCLENSIDRGAWRATVHRVTKSWTLLYEAT